jgi:hypothetical protein
MGCSFCSNNEQSTKSEGLVDRYIRPLCFSTGLSTRAVDSRFAVDGEQEMTRAGGPDIRPQEP